MAKKDPAIAQLEKSLKKITSPEQMRFIGRETVKVVVERTRKKGMGVSRPGGNRKPLKQVTKKYAKWRRKQYRHPEAAKGRKSNLTFSGEMLDKLRVMKATKKLLFIGWRDRKNNLKAEGQQAQGRPFLFLGRAEINHIIRSFEKTMDRILN